MTKKIIKVEEKKKNSTKSFNFDKIKNVIKNNPQAVKKITEGLGELLVNSTNKNTTKKITKKGTKKSTKKSSTKDVVSTINTISKMLK